MTNQQSLAKAKAEYLATLYDVKELLQRLSGAAENDFGLNIDNTIHWGHVGDIKDIEAKLQQISDKVFKEGEHAA